MSARTDGNRGNDRRWRIATFAVAVITVALFARVVAHPFIAFDDAEMILRNPQVTGPFASFVDQVFTPRAGYVVPVTVGVEAILFALSGGQAWSFHGAALVLHVLAALQLVVWARRRGAAALVATLGALAFAVHPLVVQPVAWAVCLKDLLMANLVLAATWLFLRVVARDEDAGNATGERPAGGGDAAWAIGLAVAAMLAKPTAALLGFAWLAYLGARRAARTPLLVGSMRLASIVAGLGVVIGAASRHAHDAVMGVERSPGWSPGLPLAVLGAQFRRVVWPGDLAIAYAPPASGIGEPDLWLGAFGLVAVIALGWRARARAETALPLAIACASYLPTSNVFAFARVISDSYMYLPLFMLCVLATDATKLLPRVPARRRATVSGAVIAIVALGVVSHAQLGRWRGGAALWEPVLRASPAYADAHRLLGDEHVFRGQPDLAVEPYRRFLALGYDRGYLLEFGAVLAMAGRVEDAECVLVEAFLLDAEPARAAFNYAVLLAFHPEYTPRHPAVARHILARLDAIPEHAPGALPRELSARLGPQRARIAGAHEPMPRWKPQSCAILRSR